MQHRFIRKIHGQSIRLSDLVSDLLALSRLESNDEAFDTQVDLQQVVQRVCANLQAVAQSQKVDLQFNSKDGPMVLLGDDKALGQMATNLIDNAIKYTSQSGTVKVGIEILQGRAVLSVKDDGLGIDEADQERIFERFYRVDKARSKSLGGTGLGLAIVKHIVQSHRGRLQLDSKITKGSTFTVTLPLYKQVK
jgi:two-component system phosphate regulon sensor histidine kinase PhoR